MKTAVYANVDWYDIVLGIGDAVIDPVATSAKVASILMESAEVQAMAALNAKLDVQQKQLMLCTSQDQFDAMKASMTTLANGIPELAAAIEVRRTALNLENAVWCQPGAGEALIEDADAEKLKALGGDNLKVTLGGKTVADWRNTVYWTLKAGVWAMDIVTNLGDTVPTGATKDADLTDAQRQAIGAQTETDRVSKLTDAQKLTEAQNQVQGLKSTVAGIQSQVTAGVSQASDLTAALAVYQAGLKAVNAKYGTSLS